MTGVFEAPEWDVDASGEVLNRNMFGHNSRKLSKDKEKRKKKGIKGKSKPVTLVQHKTNKVFPNIDTSTGLKGKRKSNSVAYSTVNPKRAVINKKFDSKDHGSDKKKKRKKFKTGGNENLNFEVPSKTPMSKNKIYDYQSKSSTIHKQSSIKKCVSNMEENSNAPQNFSMGHSSAGKKSQKTKSLKRNINAVSIDREFAEVPAKKQITKNQEVSYSRSSGSLPKVKRKSFSQKASEGVVNEAFVDSSLLERTFSGSVSKKFENRRFADTKYVNGIVNEAFVDESHVQEDSFSRQGPKQSKKTKGHKQNKGIINRAFSAESSVQEDSFSHDNQVTENLKKNERRQLKTKGIVNEAFYDESSPQTPEVKPSLLDTVGVQNNQSSTKKNRYCGTLRERMVAKLKVSRFRFLNEQIYTSGSSDIHKYFSKDKNAFLAYHEGFKQQVSQWPLNPLDRIINALRKKPKTLVIADFGCGDACLARSLPNVVHSFDVVALSEEVTVCDMAHTRLADGSVDVAVFCLSLMGTNLVDYLLEANRVLKVGGQLKIAEVESRFEDVDTFILNLKKFGFSNTLKDLSHSMFYFLDFRKDGKAVKKGSLPPITLKPCLYKKR